jgi:hypothetical protein
MKDQIFRGIYQVVEKKYGQDSAQMDYFWNVVERQDRIFEKEVTRLIVTYGWLSISKVGRLANTSIWLIIQHASKFQN